MSLPSDSSRPDGAAEAQQRNGDAQGASGGQQGWLATLRARLGLSGPPTLRDTLEYALKEEAKTAAAFSAEEREMLLRLLRFGALRVDDIMVPRADIIAIAEGSSIADLLKLFEEAGVSRIPVFGDTLDDPRGMVHIKDLMRWLSGVARGQPDGAPAPAAPAALASRPLELGRVNLATTIAAANLRRPVLYVPPSMPAMNLLLRMQSTRIHLALVVDEYGGTDGLISIEDLVEQIVGDIEDEHDVDEAKSIVEDPKHGLLAAARTPIPELEAHLGLKLLEAEEVEDIDTLGGLIFHIVGRVPTRGELVPHKSGLEFEVLDADARRVKKLKIHRPKPAPASPPAAPPPAASAEKSA